MRKMILMILAGAMIVVSAACAEKDTTPPSVVITSPQNGSLDVDPSLTELSVVFNEEMKDGNWSWAYADKNKFPVMTGQPRYVDNNTKNILPVKLESGREYVVWINTSQYQNFKDKSGNPAIPFKLSFKTK